jgi:aminoglycoside phosphotransferase (APT) family kinase protein
VVKHAVGPQYSAWVEREYQVLEMLRALQLPVPQPFGFHKHVTARGPEAWLVMQWIGGRTVRTVLAREHNREVRAEIVAAWARSLAALHATPPPSGLDSVGSWLDDRLAQAAYNLQHFTVDGDAVLLRRLERERPASEPQTLIHGDFTLDNTMVEGGAVMGIIDWSGGAVGDPRYDLVLATKIKPGIFGKRDYDLFWDTYGRAPLSKDDRAYFEDLYEFF